MYLPGDLSWVFGSAEKKRILKTLRKDPPLSKLAASRRSESLSLVTPCDVFSGDAGLEDKALWDKSTTATVLEKGKVLKQRLYGSQAADGIV